MSHGHLAVSYENYRIDCLYFCGWIVKYHRLFFILYLFFTTLVMYLQVDAYGTVQPHTLIRQYMDYKHWYDRAKLSLKDILNVMFVSSMNPTAGSFTIDSRLQRHFYVFALG